MVESAKMLDRDFESRDKTLSNDIHIVHIKPLSLLKDCSFTRPKFFEIFLLEI